MTTTVMPKTQDNVHFSVIHAYSNDAKAARLLSLDALRDFDMFWIIGGASIIRGFAKVWLGPFTTELNQQLEHVPWVGLHFFDVI